MIKPAMFPNVTLMMVIVILQVGVNMMIVMELLRTTLLNGPLMMLLNMIHLPMTNVLLLALMDGKEITFVMRDAMLLPVIGIMGIVILQLIKPYSMTNVPLDVPMAGKEINTVTKLVMLTNVTLIMEIVVAVLDALPIG